MCFNVNFSTFILSCLERLKKVLLSQGQYFPWEKALDMNLFFCLALICSRCIHQVAGMHAYLCRCLLDSCPHQSTFFGTRKLWLFELLILFSLVCWLPVQMWMQTEYSVWISLCSLFSFTSFQTYTFQIIKVSKLRKSGNFNFPNNFATLMRTDYKLFAFRVHRVHWQGSVWTVDSSVPLVIPKEALWQSDTDELQRSLWKWWKKRG